MANPTVTIEIKEIGARHVIGRLRAVQTAASDLSRAKRRLSRRVKSTGETFKKSGKDVSRFSGLMQNLETNAVLALGPLSGIGARIRAIGVLARRGNVGLVAFSLGIAAVVGVALLLTTALIKARKALEPIEGRLRAVTGSALLARLELERLRKLALNLGLSVDSLSDGFSRLAAAARGTSLEGEGIRRVFDGVAKAAAALRLSVEDTEGILRAFEQALTKGVLRAEEFNQQLGDRLPGAAVLAAKAIGKTKQQFQAMLVAGEIITEEFLPKLIEQFEELFSAEAERNVETLNGSLNRLKTSFSIFFDVLESRIGVARFVTQVLNRMADEIIRVTGVIESSSSKASRALALFGKDILQFELVGVLQTEKDIILKTFTDLRNELQKEFNGIQADFLRMGDAFELGSGSLINVSDKLSELGAKKKEIDALTAAIVKLNEFAIKPLSETTPPDITKITKAFDKFVRAAVTASKRTRQIVAGSLFGAEFEDSLLKAQNRLDKFSKNVVVAFADANKLISEGLSKAFKEGEEVEKAQAFAEILGVVSDKFATVIQSAKDFKAIGKIFESTRTPLEKFNIEMAELVRLLSVPGANQDAISRAMENLKAELLEANEVFKLLQGTLDSISGSFIDILKSGDSAFRIIGELVQSLLEDVLKLIIQLEVINPILNSISGRTPPSEGGAGLAVGIFDKIKEFFVGTQTVAKADTAFAETAFSKVSAMGVETAVYAKANFANSDVAFMKVGTLVTGDSGGGGGGILGGLLGGLLGGGGGGGGLVPLSGGGLGGGPIMLAHGGSTPTNKPFIVGERGPEVLSFNRSGFVTPNNQLGGTTIVNQQFDLRGASLEAVALLKQEAAAIKREVLEAVDQKRRRGIDRARV